jgi:hypothetical protein
MMSPELLHKFESPSNLTGPVNSSGNIVSILEQSLDSSKEIILAEEKPLPNPNEHVIQLETPSVDTAKQTEEEIQEEDEGDEIGTDIVEAECNIVNASDEKDQDDEDSNGDEVGLFEVSVDISETLSDDSPASDDDSKRSSLTFPETPGKRRSSRWSATVLFLASEVQMMVNLANLTLPEGYEMAPKKVRHYFTCSMYLKSSNLE